MLAECAYFENALFLNAGTLRRDKRPPAVRRPVGTPKSIRVCWSWRGAIDRTDVPMAVSGRVDELWLGATARYAGRVNTKNRCPEPLS